MTPQPLKIVILGGNGHATTFRSLVRELAARGHQVVFLEREVKGYAENQEFPSTTYVRIELYQNLAELKRRFGELIRHADVVVVGSFVPEGIAVGEWVVRTAEGVTAFYDIDTPVTLATLERGENNYLSRDLIRKYQLYLSFTGGPILERLEQVYRAPMVRALYCSADPDLYFSEAGEVKWDLGYLGTYSADRQASLQRLLVQPAQHWRQARFVVAGPQYPNTIRWPENVERIEHLAPGLHRAFYNQQRFTLNITRQEMLQAGHSPSVRLFEAAACGTPIISDYWEGLETFFELGEEILVARSGESVLHYLRDFKEADRRRVGERARQRVLGEHTSRHRAEELEGYIFEVRSRAVPAERAL